MSFTPAQSVYHKDTFSSIIKFLPWKDLIQCYSYDCTASDLVLPEIRRRISALVSLFIPTKDVLEFFEILRDSDGLICGSAARYVLLPYNPAANDGPLPNAMPLPNDLNVLVAHDRAELFFQFFAGLEYEYSIERADTLYASHVTKVEVFTKTRVGQKDARITLSLCKNNVLSTLLRSPTTSEMNAITFDAVYSLYPRLTYANEGLILGRITQENVEVDRLRAGGGVKLFRVNEHWTKPCGWYCPMRIRKTYDDPGTGNTKRVKCVLFSPQCLKPHLVPVPVRKVRGAVSGLTDVFYRVHVNVYSPDRSTFYTTNNIVFNGSLGGNAGVADPYTYTLFRSNHPYDKLNRLIRSFTGGSRLRVSGPLIVVKSDQNGAVCNVTPRELYHIERLVVHTLANAGFNTPTALLNDMDTFDFSDLSDADIVA
ncbi:hypothetical protein MD484_g402, partial [Candolleomyces efflorescens]